MLENTRPREQHILLLEIGVNPDNQLLKKNLFEIYNHFQIHEESNACVNFISSLPVDQRNVFLIVVGTKHEHLAEMIIDLPQIVSIYLYDPKKKSEELRSTDKKFIRFVTNNWKDLFYAITRDIELNEDIPPALSTFTFNTTTFERSVRDLCSDQQSATFVWFQLLVDVIRQLPHTIKDKEDMIAFLREYFDGCPIEQGQLNQFINEYIPSKAIYWYTKTGFLFRVLNRALRSQNIDNIFKLRYFLQDLYNQMEREYVEQCHYLETITVYRGQLMHEDDFDTLLKNSASGSLIAFNSFMSTTCDDHLASIFAGSQANIDIRERSVLFKIVLNFQKSKIPLVYIAHLSAVKAEEETLLAMGSVFRIDQIAENQDEKRWDVNLTLNEEVSERLSAMINQLKREMSKDSTLMILGQFLGDMGDLYRAERYFHLLLHDLPHDHPDLGTVLNNLGIIAHKRNQHATALAFFHRALQVLPDDHGDQACVYSNIGANYQAIGDDDKAIDAYKKALMLNLFPSDKAKVYNNMGSIYRHRCQYNESIKYHQLSLKLRSSNDPEAVNAQINLAFTYADLQDYPRSLIHAQKALDAIRILPIGNPLIGRIYFACGFIKAKMGQHLAAIGHFADALSAYRQMTTTSAVTNAIIKTLHEQGRSHMELNQNTSAPAGYNEILSLTSTDCNHHDGAALAHHSIGQINHTENAFRWVLQSYMTVPDIWNALLQANPKVHCHIISQILNDIAETYDMSKRHASALWYYAQAIQFAEGDAVLVQEYKDSFQAAANQAWGILQKTLNVHIIRLE